MPHPSPSGCANLSKSAPRRRGGTERQGTRLSKTRLQRVARLPPCARLSFAVRGAAPVSLSSLKSPHYRRAGRSRGATPPRAAKRGSRERSGTTRGSVRPHRARTASLHALAPCPGLPHTNITTRVRRWHGKSNRNARKGGGPRKRAQLRLFSAVEAWQQLRHVPPPPPPCPRASPRRGAACSPTGDQRARAAARGARRAGACYDV